jgi:hypothetical protein
MEYQSQVVSEAGVHAGEGVGGRVEKGVALQDQYMIDAGVDAGVVVRAKSGLI